MDLFTVYILLLGIIAVVGILFNRFTIPTSLLLVLVGIFLSLLPHVPRINLQPNVVLEIFLPLIIYEISVLTSWRDFKSNAQPIALLSIGHVIFITCLVAFIIHLLIPELGWPMSFVIGAIVSPPDDIAIVAIAEKINLPQRIIIILKGEGMLNDATALILFKFSLAAVITHEFSLAKAISSFSIILVGETIYGLILGHLIGWLRIKLQDPVLQVIISVLTPFLAYLPAQKLGGSGVLATVVTGMVIGHLFLSRFSPNVRLLAISIWSTLTFILQSILFLLVGLDFRFIIESISSIPGRLLLLYSLSITATVIIGRFLWVYPTAYLPRLSFFSQNKPKTSIPWQSPFIISWAGMRGGVSLAAALVVPSLPATIQGANPRNLLVFLVFCVIVATLLLQGLALPWVIRALGISRRAEYERYQSHLTELRAQLSIYEAALRWLIKFKKAIKNDEKLLAEVNFYIWTYITNKKKLKERIHQHDIHVKHDEELELRASNFLLNELLEVERKALDRLWQEEQIDHAVRNKLLSHLDLRSKHLTE